MRIKFLMILIPVILLLGGCVSSGKYKACLADFDGCKNKATGLEETLKGENEKKARLEVQLADSVKALKALEEDNANLKQLIGAKEEALTMEVVMLRGKLAEGERRVLELEAQMKAQAEEAARLKTEIEQLSAEKEKAVEEKNRAVAELKSTYDNLVSELNEEIKKGEIAITQLKGKLSLSMVENILFGSGSSEVKKDGRKVLDRIGGIVRKVTDKQIRVEGHTDNVPIRAGSKLAEKFPSNWELSAARATNVVRYLQEKGGVDPSRLITAGYSEFRPVASNDTEEGKAKNRRIDIVLIPLEETQPTE